jgi:hypothetical protein
MLLRHTSVERSVCERRVLHLHVTFHIHEMALTTRTGAFADAPFNFGQNAFDSVSAFPEVLALFAVIFLPVVRATQFGLSPLQLFAYAIERFAMRCSRRTSLLRQSGSELVARDASLIGR